MDEKTFYCIKLINNNTGKRGYLLDSKDGIMISEDVFVAGCKQFKTYQEAQAFMRDNKLESNGVSAHIRDNGDIMKEMAGNGLKPRDKNKKLWSIVGIEGAVKDCNLFYDNKGEGYYFDTPQVGYCFWEDEKSADDAIEGLGLKGKAIAKEI